MNRVRQSHFPSRRRQRWGSLMCGLTVAKRGLAVKVGGSEMLMMLTVELGVAWWSGGEI